MNNLLCCDIFNNRIDNLFQWDSNQSIRVKGLAGLSPLPVFQMSKTTRGSASDIIPKPFDGDLVVTIPNELLTSPGILHIYMCSEDGEAHRQTISTAHIPVAPRIKAIAYNRAIVGQAIVGESVVAYVEPDMGLVGSAVVGAGYVS